MSSASDPNVHKEPEAEDEFNTRWYLQDVPVYNAICAHEQQQRNMPRVTPTHPLTVPRSTAPTRAVPAPAVPAPAVPAPAVSVADSNSSPNVFPGNGKGSGDKEKGKELPKPLDDKKRPNARQASTKSQPTTSTLPARPRGPEKETAQSLQARLAPMQSSFRAALGQPLRYTCGFADCAAQFTFQEELVLHNETQHTIPGHVKPYYCGSCPEHLRFKTRRQLRQHLMNPQVHAFLLFSCRCGKMFTGKGSFRLHLENISCLGDDRPLYCPCGHFVDSRTPQEIDAHLDTCILKR